MRWLWVGVFCLVGCTKHNPDSCCTSAVECEQLGLDQTYECSSGRVCSAGTCVAPECAVSSDCRDSARPLCSNQLCVPQTCYGGEGWEACYDSPPAGAKQLGAALDTSTGSPDCEAPPESWLSAAQPDACFVVAESISINATTVVKGTRPLVLIASDAISVAGTLDVASHRAGLRGPGSPSTSCAPFNGLPTTHNSAGAGGAGGSFITRGGDGGVGDANGAIGGVSASSVNAPAVLRAGCDGQGGASGTGNGGEAGKSGGAVYIAAMNRITISGTINASGAGGSGGGFRAGAGGGGSGGMIVLYSADIVATSSTVIANGGGGAGGSDGSTRHDVHGLDPDPGMPFLGGAGAEGVGGLMGGGYGDPAGANSHMGLDGQTGQGGGGGGGGLGYIRANHPLDDANVSPVAAVL